MIDASYLTPDGRNMYLIRGSFDFLQTKDFIGLLSATVKRTLILGWDISGKRWNKNTENRHKGNRIL